MIEVFILYLLAKVTKAICKVYSKIRGKSVVLMIKMVICENTKKRRQGFVVAIGEKHMNHNSNNN